MPPSSDTGAARSADRTPVAIPAADPAPSPISTADPAPSPVSTADRAPSPLSAADRAPSPLSAADGASSPLAAESTAVLPAGVDLHARPAAHFVRTALGFRARIEVRAGERDADAKSLLSVLALGAKAGTPLRLRADGEDATVALEALGRCVAGLTE